MVNTYDPTHRLWIGDETAAYHEGVPGHVLQVSLAQELRDVPKFRQHIENYNGPLQRNDNVAFVEGWALYAEQLGEEVGFYQDPWSMYGHLEGDLLRAIRLVADTGLHYKGWTRDQVVKFFHEHSAVDEISVQRETDRYIAEPASVLSYKVGEQTILRLRDEAKVALGDAFDIRAFHDEVLGAGALPLYVLERRIRAWIERTKSAGSR
jgi:uncharacterized protein (DUF885 family)